MTEHLTLRVNGKIYGGWLTANISRGIEEAVGEAQFTVTERWASSNKLRQIKPFDACQVYANDELLLTGWIEKYSPSFAANQRQVHIVARSKTVDLVQPGEQQQHAIPEI